MYYSQYNVGMLLTYYNFNREVHKGLLVNDGNRQHKYYVKYSNTHFILLL